MSEAGRLRELDALRGIAALAVVLYHYLCRYHDLYGHDFVPSPVLNYLSRGVDLFFIISGFVIFMTLSRTRRPLDFVVSRLTRLLPAYLAAVILTFAVVSLTGLPGREVDWREAAINLTMLQGHLGVRPVDGVYWTLSVELSFYLLVFLAWLGGWLRSFPLAGAVWLGASQAVVLAAKLKLLAITPLMSSLFFFPHVPCFLAGMTLYRIRSAGWSRPLAALLLASAAAVLLQGVGPALLTGAFILVFLLVGAGRATALLTPPLPALGGISYALYLAHQNIGYVVMRQAQAAGLGSPAAVGLALVVSLTLALCLTRWIERPTMASLRALYRGRSGHVPRGQQPATPPAS